MSAIGINKTFCFLINILFPNLVLSAIKLFSYDISHKICKSINKSNGEKKTKSSKDQAEYTNSLCSIAVDLSCRANLTSF